MFIDRQIERIEKKLEQLHQIKAWHEIGLSLVKIAARTGMTRQWVAELFKDDERNDKPEPENG